MPITTRDKRASAVMVGLPWRGILPTANGSLNAQDRAILVYLYAGVFGASLPGPARFMVVPVDDRTITVPVEGRTVVIAVENRTIVVPVSKDNG